MSVEPVRILAFVNHIAPVPGIEADIARVSARLVAAGWPQPAPEHSDNHP